MSLARWRAAGLVWPTLLTVAGLAVLAGLGTWQLQRKAWKEALIAAIAARSTAQPRELDGSFLLVGGPLGAEYARVTVTGRYLHGQERHLYAPAREGPGWHVITPLRRDDGTLVLVNRGWVPDHLRDPAKRAGEQAAGPVRVTGLLRRAEAPGWFLAENDPKANRWYWRDIPAMWRCRPGTEQTADCRDLAGTQPMAGLTLPTQYPMLIDTEAGPVPAGGYPRGGTTRLVIPNRHLEYALTWYGLAATLIGVFAAFAATRLRASPTAD